MPAKALTASLFEGYKPLPGVYDEMLTPSGSPRPAWQEMRPQLDRIGTGELRRRWTRSQRLIQENGIVYSAYGDADNQPRSWALDPAPLLLPESDWSDLAAGLKQRVRLLELVLLDLYGEQSLIASGLLPAELLYEHPGYRLPLHRRVPSDLSPADAQPAEMKPRPMLHLYAADLGRAPDGAWWVLADRTEAPSGAGFALENRLVTSRMLAEPFRDRRVCRLAPFFKEVQTALRECSPIDRGNPSVALLSQGAAHPNYFEDAYLARYLGYTLVEGGDLTVRNRRLWMKTLDGLMPIDVLVRRPNTDLCDPLELGGASQAGVAGLLQAERDGSLVMANASGSGLVESPVFMAFMPRLCQAILGESLKLPGVATWWCGEPESLEYVVENLDRLVLKKAYRTRGQESLLMAELRETPRDKLIGMIRSDPRAYVGQELVKRSATPAWRDGKLVPERVALRAFAVASDGDYQIMQGALARTTANLAPLETTALSGEGSKDVWILGEKPVERITLLPGEHESTELVRIGAELPSRVADHSFWLGRYIERADASARLLRLVTTRLTSEEDASAFIELPALIRGLAEQGQIEAGYAVAEMRNQLPKVEATLAKQVLGQNQGGTLASTIGGLLISASQVRDRLSRDTWRIVLRIKESLNDAAGATPDLTDILNLTDELVIDLAAVGGMVIESMTRTQFYRFLDIGRRLERAMQSVDLLHATLIEMGESSPALLEALLESADSLMTYRSRYRASVKLAPVLDLLITDETNPRSIAYQVNTLYRHVGKLPRTGEGEPGDPLEKRLALALTHGVRMADIQALSESYELDHHGPLAGLLGNVARDLPALSNAIALKYLSHAGPPRQLAPV